MIDYSNSNLCRICETTHNLSDLFEDTNRHALKKLRALTDVNIDKADLLPKLICLKCLKNLEFAYTFKIQCEYTDRKYRDTICSAKTETDELVFTNEPEVEQESSQQPVTSADFNVDQIIMIDDGGGSTANDLYENEHDSCTIEEVEEMAEEDEEHLVFDADFVEANLNVKYEVEQVDEQPQLNEILDDGLPKEETDIVEVPECETLLDEIAEESIDGEIIEFGNSEAEEEEEERIDDDLEVLDEFEMPEFGADETNEDHKVSNATKNSESEDSEQALICEHCGSMFANKAKLNKHKKTHGDMKFQCNQCFRWFTKRYHLMNHMITHTGEKRFKCNQCDKIYTNHGNLDRHIRVFHQKERRHVCTTCGKGFSQSTQLRQHIAVHVDEPSFECDVCQKRFKTPEYLNLHKDRHLPKDLRRYKTYKSTKKSKPNIKECICTFCGKKSNTVALHQSHMRTHTGEKPYECQTCGKKFSFQQSLRNHVLLHTNSKPFKCDECGRSFRQIGHLKGHQLVHSGEKKFECVICSKTFALRGNLTVHMRIHTGESPYQCDICPKKFYDSNGLKRHKTVHTKQQQQNGLDQSMHIFVQLEVEDGEEENGQNMEEIVGDEHHMEHEIETHLNYHGENEAYSTIFNMAANAAETEEFKIIKEEY